MASSGWQGARQITNYASMDLCVNAISHSGDTLYLNATLRVTCTAFYMYDQTGNAYLGVTGGGTQGITYDLTPYSNPPYVERTFNCTISSPSSATTAVVTGEFSGSGVYRAESWTLYFDPAGTAPTDLTATLVDFGPDWAQIAVSISSYGTPSTSANRYIEAGVCQGPNYGGPYKYATAQAVTSNTFTISNTSPGGTMTIAPNTSYIYGGYATNNTVDVATVGGTFVTLPSAPVLSAIDMGGGQIEVDVTHAAEGSAYQVTEEYSVDGGTTWNPILNNKFSLLLNAQTVVTVRRVSTAGASTSTITITPQFTTAIYASVINQTKKVKHIYASVNDQTKKVKKVYVSVNGLTKKVFEDI